MSKVRLKNSSEDRERGKIKENQSVSLINQGNPPSEEIEPVEANMNDILHPNFLAATQSVLLKQCIKR